MAHYSWSNEVYPQLRLAVQIACVVPSADIMVGTLKKILSIVRYNLMRFFSLFARKHPY